MAETTAAWPTLLAALLVTSCCLGSLEPRWAPDIPTLATAHGPPVATPSPDFDPDTIWLFTHDPDHDALPEGIYFVSARTGVVRAFQPADATLPVRLSLASPALRRTDGMVWTAPEDEPHGVYLLAADGSFRVLHAAPNAFAFALAPDGTHVAYHLQRDDIEPHGQYLTVAAIPSDAAAPTTQSADGRIAFVGADHLIVRAGLETMRTTLAGSESHAIQALAGVDHFTPSPDGSRIACVGQRAGGDGIVLMDGTGERPHVVLDAPVADLAWSPDSMFLAARLPGALDAPSTEIRILDRDGSQIADITLPGPTTPNDETAGENYHYGITDYAWSPDGSKLALVVDLAAGCSNSTSEATCGTFLYLVQRDGSDLTRVSDQRFGAASVFW